MSHYNTTTTGNTHYNYYIYDETITTTDTTTYTGVPIMWDERPIRYVYPPQPPVRITYEDTTSDLIGLSKRLESLEEKVQDILEMLQALMPKLLDKESDWIRDPKIGE